MAHSHEGRQTQRVPHPKHNNLKDHMNFNLTLSADQVNVVLAGLNKLEHGQARGPFDHILQQVQKQEAAAMAAPAPEDIQSAGLSD
jgi:hypothetical protein